MVLSPASRQRYHWRISKVGLAMADHDTRCHSPRGDMMRTHREFFQDEVGPMADIVFVGCSVTNAAGALSPSGGGAPRRQVVLGGRRVKTVDVHAHCAVPEAMALMGSTVSPQALLMVQEPVQERVRKMDAQSID